MVTKYSDCHKADDKYTKAKFNYVWRIFKIGKYKDQEVKKVCYCNPSYIMWCLSNWSGFKLTNHERFDLIKGLKRQLENNPNNEELVRVIQEQEALYKV